MNRIVLLIIYVIFAFLPASASGKKERFVVRSTADFVNNITKENVTFEIRGNVNLNGHSYTLQNGCELKVISGYIVNGMIKGWNTKLTINKPSTIGVKLEGTWNAPVINDTFFIKKQLPDDEIIANINQLQSKYIFNAIYLNKRKYSLTIKESGGYALRLLDSTKLVNKSEIILRGNNHKGYSIISISKAKNVEVCGGKIKGDVGVHTYQSGTTSEWGMGITIDASENVVVRDIRISNCTGDGIYVCGLPTSYIGDYTKASKNVVLRNVTCDSNRRQGLSIICVDGLLVDNCSFINTGKIEKTAPSSGIDIEPNVAKGRNNSVRNITIRRCKFKGNKGRSFESDLSVSDGNIVNFSNIVVEGCVADGQFFIGTPNVVVKNCKMESILIRPYEAPMNALFETCQIMGQGIIVRDPHKHEALYNNRRAKRTQASLTLRNCRLVYSDKSRNQNGYLITIEGSSNHVSTILLDSCSLFIPPMFLNAELLQNKKCVDVRFRKCRIRAEKAMVRRSVAKFEGCSGI